jgi:hypothetical protein
MSFSRWLRPPHRLLSLFLSITLVLAAALVWLGWRILEQDRALEGQRIQERLAQAADLASASLLHSLASLEQQVSALSVLPDALREREAPETAQQLGADALVVAFRPDDVAAFASSRLLYYPGVHSAPPPRSPAFDAAEGFEFRQENYSKAAALYRQLIHSGDPAIRAGAWRAS